MRCLLLRYQRSDGKLGGLVAQCYFRIREIQEKDLCVGRNSVDMKKMKAGLGIEESVEFVKKDEPFTTDEQLQCIANIGLRSS